MYWNHRLILTNPELPNYLPSPIRHAFFGTSDPVSWSILGPNTPNLFEPLLFPSHPVEKSSAAMAGVEGAKVATDGLGQVVLKNEELYERGWKDVLFVAYHIIFFSL